MNKPKLHAVEQPLPKTADDEDWFKHRHWQEHADGTITRDRIKEFISDAEKENRPLVNRHDSGAKVLDVDAVLRKSERLPDADNKY